MAISRAQKEEAVSSLVDVLSGFSLAVLTDYRGLTVPEIEDLRSELRREGISYRISKNTLLKIAVSRLDNLKDIDPSVFSGPIALAVSAEDEIAPAKVIFQFAKTHKALEIVGAITPEGEILNAAAVKALATLPSREQLLGQLVGTLAAPISGLIGVAGNTSASIVRVLAVIATTKE